MTDDQLIKFLRDEAFRCLEQGDNKILLDLLLEAAARIESFIDMYPYVSDLNTSVSGHWIDNADSYICSNCGYETNNPSKQVCGPNRCICCGCTMK